MSRSVCNLKYIFVSSFQRNYQNYKISKYNLFWEEGNKYSSSIFWVLVNNP